MSLKDWKYYNHAAISSLEPHEVPDLSCVKDKSIWKVGGGTPLLARWTTDYDCGYETGWWYLIKDTPFETDSLKAKRRYEINKGKKNFLVKRINPSDYIEELYQVLICAYSSWPEKYRPNVQRRDFEKELVSWQEHLVYAGFDRNTNEMCGFAYLNQCPKHLAFSVLRVKPEMERDGINAAMVAGILEDNNNKIGKDFYICDGERSIRHETYFQDYLIKYFGFRKAYCKLHVIYRFPLNIAIAALFPLRHKIKNEGRAGSILSALLRMEEYSRQC